MKIRRCGPVDGSGARNSNNDHLYYILTIMSNVLLLREPSQGVPDRYQTTLTSSGYRTICVPVLETVHTNLNALKDIIRDPKAFRGVIITSKRVCEAWKLALADLDESPPEDREGVGWCD